MMPPASWHYKSPLGSSVTCGLVCGQHTRARSQNCSYPHLLQKRYFVLPALAEAPLMHCTAQPGLLPSRSTPLRWALERLLPACCSHRKARWEPFLSHTASQLLPPDLATPRSHSRTHFPRSPMRMMVFAVSAWATSLFYLLFLRLAVTRQCLSSFLQLKFHIQPWSHPVLWENTMCSKAIPKQDGNSKQFPIKLKVNTFISWLDQKTIHT